MTTLQAPASNTKVIRRSAGMGFKKPGVWHFLKQGKGVLRRCLCGDIISSLHEIEVASLVDVKEKDLCASCWRFGSVELQVI